MSLLSRRAEALAPSLIREMSRRRKPTSVDLSLGQPARSADEDILRGAFADLLRTGTGYTDNAGLFELREAIARRHAIPGRDRAENVIVTVGSEEAVFLAVLASVDPGDEVLVPEPGYPAYAGIVRLLGGVPVAYPIERSSGLRVSAAEVEARLGARARAIILNSPSNPFGAVDERAELERLAALAGDRGLVLISDEIYRDLVYGRAPPLSVAELTPRSLFVAGLSKSCSFTGLRLGYLIADEGFVRKATLAHQLAVTCAPRLAQLAALRVLMEPSRLGANLPYYEEARRTIRERASLLPPGAELLLGEGAFYAVLDVAAYARGDPMALALELLEEEDVVVVPGTAFGPSGAWFWRLSYAAGAGAAGEGLERIARFLERRARPLSTVDPN